jgi:hypothetical protein
MSNDTDVVGRFGQLYLGDSLLLQLVLDTTASECRLTFNLGKVLRPGSSDIFDPERTFRPAILVLRDVKSVHFADGPYQLNSTVVDFEATAAGDGRIDFKFVMTGGTDNDSFMATLKVVATDFGFGPLSMATPQ